MDRPFSTVRCEVAPALRPHPQASPSELVGKLEMVMLRVVQLPLRMEDGEPHWNDLRGVVAVCLREEGINDSIGGAAKCRVVRLPPRSVLPKKDSFRREELQAALDAGTEVRRAVEVEVETADHLGRPGTTKFHVTWNADRRALVLDVA